MRPLSSLFRPSLTSPATTAIGPCFRTDAEGRIPLTRDWLALFTQARSFDRLVLQTRHPCARLLSLGPVPSFPTSPVNGVISDPDAHLHLNLAHWHHASGRLAHCPCCGSPGRIEIHDTHGVEFLQLCAHADASPAAWAAYLSTVSAPLNATLPSPPASAVRNFFARLPADAAPFTHDAHALTTLIEILAAEEIAFACTLHTPAIIHTREFTPRRVACEDGLLTVSDGAITLQAALDLAQGLAVQIHEDQPRLHLLGPDHTSLLIFHPAADPAAAFLWGASLRTVFPSLD